MNELIKSFFGDPYITLDCLSSDCIGNNTPVPPVVDRYFPIMPIIFALVLISLVVGIVKYTKRAETHASLEESERLLNQENGSPPCDLSFRNISYIVPSPSGTKHILSNVHGMVKSGEVMAIMGSSGKFNYM
jgi:hypothetical protein